MQVFDHRLWKRLLSVIDDIVDRPEMVAGLNDVINSDSALFEPNRMCFEDKTRLLLWKLTPFNVVGIVGKFDLRSVIDAAF